MNPDKIHVKDSSKTDTINKRSMDLIHVVNSFLDPFLASELPLGLRLLSKLLLNLALPHFDRDERQAHRIVGGLLFLRYYNPAIIDIVTSHPHPEFRSSRMRRNLILVAKVLQNLSNGVLFGDKEQYMSHLNLYLGKRSEDLFDFFHRTTDVFDLDENLSMHSPPGVPYKSVTYSSASEMLRFYDLLTEFTNINPRCAYSKSRILLSSDRDALCSITSLQLIKVDINNVEEEIDEKGKRDTIIDSIRLTGLPRLFYFILKTNFLSLYSFPTGVSVPQQCCDFFTLVSKFCRSQGNFDTAALYRQASDKFNDLCGDDSTCEDTLNSTLQVVADYINDRRRCLLFFQKENACLLSGLSSLQAQAEPLCSLSKSSNVLLGASLNQFLQPPTDMVDSAVLMGESGLIGSLLNRMIRIAASIRRKSSANFLDTLHDSDLLGYSLDLVRKLKVSGALLMIESIVKALNSSPQFVSCWTAQRFCLNIGVDASDRSEFLYFEKIFEYLSVEMILAVIPVLNNHAPEELQVSLVDLAFQSPLPVPHGSSPSRIQTLQQLIRERWRQVLTLIRPVSVMHIVGRFLSSPPSDLSSVLDCVSMLRFDVTSPLDVSALSLFLRRHLFILRSGFVSTEQMNLHLSSLCFSISNIDFVLLEACEDTELSISCFQDVSAIYFWFLNVLRDTSLDRRLINTLGTAVMRCAPAEFYQCHVEAFVFDHLIAHLFREKNLVALRLKSLCRFLCHEEKATRVLPARIFRTIADNLTTDNFKKCYHCIEELVDVIVALAGHQFDLTVRGLLSDMLRFRMFRRDSKPLFAVPPIQIFVGLQVLTRIVNDKYQFCDLASRIGPKSEGFKVDMISAVSSFFAPLIADIISICDREVGLKLTGMLSEQQVDLVESAPNYMGSITWERHDAWISIFSACINLCPDVMLDSFLSSSIRTYGVSGNSVIKLLLHSDKRIAQSAHCSLVRIVRQFPVERLQVLEGALVLFSDSLVQSSVGRQITLLSHLTSLLQCVRADDAFAEDFLHSPGFMSWRLSADAMVLLGLCSHHSSVRRASCELVSALGDLAGSSLSLLSFMKDDSVISASLKRNCDSLTSGASIHLFTTENTDRESVRRRRDALRILGSQCCEIPEYYNAILCLRRHLCSLLFDNDVSPNILEKSRSSMLILLFSIASPLESSVDDAVGFESICRPCRVITAEQSISKVFACPTLISAWTLSYMHWRSVGTVIRTILFQWNTLLAMDPARRHVTACWKKTLESLTH
uniref:Ras-GAP domain-containing protein n=1 Tax=Spongospora subterranea TaxID=70186 RepID=A0A0H5R461_9EUKA|eukprot:CRZ02814.1 hypothetical protein [Spongospora subterranea]